MLATITIPISTHFNALDQISWIATTYAIGSSVSQPLSGHLTDIFGRRSGLVACYFLFMVGTLLSGLSFYATSTHGSPLWLFLLGRVAQGLGGGSLCSITSFIESDLVPLKKRPLIEGIGNVAYGAMLAVGGFYGGAVHEAIGWSWAFLIQVPVIAVDALLVLLVVRVPSPRRQQEPVLVPGNASRPRPGLPTPSSSESMTPMDDSNLKKKTIDYLGCFLILLSITLFQLGINNSGTSSSSSISSSSWNNPLTISALTISGITMIAFISWELRTSSSGGPALIPIRMLVFNRTIGSSQASYFFANAAFSSVLFYVPIYLQVLGASAAKSGLQLVPYAASFAVGSFVAGAAVERLGRYYLVNVFVQILAVGGVTCLCTMDSGTPSWVLYVYLVVLGLGYGGGYVTRLMGLLTSADKETQAVIQAASWTIGSTGSALGISVASVIFQKLTQDQLADMDMFKADPGLLDAIRKSFGALDGLPGNIRQDIVAIYTSATRGPFFFSLGTIVAAAAASLVMKNNKIK